MGLNTDTVYSILHLKGPRTTGGRARYARNVARTAGSGVRAPGSRARNPTGWVRTPGSVSKTPGRYQDPPLRGKGTPGSCLASGTPAPSHSVGQIQGNPALPPRRAVSSGPASRHRRPRSPSRWQRGPQGRGGPRRGGTCRGARPGPRPRG